MIIKLSWTSLKAWERHEYDDAIGHYLGKRLPTTPEIELGSAKHQQWGDYIKKHNRIPEELGGGEVKKPIVEEFFGVTLPFSEKYKIHVISRVDLFSEGIVTDWKCGKSRPGYHLNGKASQLGLYQLTLEANGHKVHEGRITCFNPYTNTCETGIQYLDEKTKDAALEFIMTFGSEMIQHLELEGLLKDYDPDWMNKPASEGQLKLMESRGITAPEGVTKGQASKLIDGVKA